MKDHTYTCNVKENIEKIMRIIDGEYLIMHQSEIEKFSAWMDLNGFESEDLLVTIHDNENNTYLVEAYESGDLVIRSLESSLDDYFKNNLLEAIVMSKVMSEVTSEFTDVEFSDRVTITGYVEFVAYNHDYVRYTIVPKEVVDGVECLDEIDWNRWIDDPEYTSFEER